MSAGSNARTMGALAPLLSCCALACGAREVVAQKAGLEAQPSLREEQILAWRDSPECERPALGSCALAGWPAIEARACGFHEETGPQGSSVPEYTLELVAARRYHFVETGAIAGTVELAESRLLGVVQRRTRYHECHVLDACPHLETSLLLVRPHPKGVLEVISQHEIPGAPDVRIREEAGEVIVEHHSYDDCETHSLDGEMLELTCLDPPRVEIACTDRSAEPPRRVPRPIGTGEDPLSGLDGL